MIIKSNQTIDQIQKAFSEKFPFLKIEFYSAAHKVGEGSPSRQQIDMNTKIGDISTTITKSDVSINGHLKVKTLEQTLKEQFGLNAQVFRRSGSIWLQTTKTDDWTLSDQNSHGEQSSKTNN